MLTEAVEGRHCILISGDQLERYFPKRVFCDSPRSEESQEHGNYDSASLGRCRAL